MPATAGQPEKFTEIRWQEYMSEPRGLYLFGQALQDPRTFDEAASRILHIVLAPDIRKLPFPLKLEEPGYSLLNESLRRRDQWLKHLSKQNSEQAATIIVNNLTELKDLKGEDAEVSRRQLINLIPFIIPKISDEAAGKLIEQFDMNAFIYVKDGSRGDVYDPLENLFSTEGVRDYWKMVIAKRQVHPQILAEKPKKGINWRKMIEGEQETLAVRYARILDRSQDRRQLDNDRLVEEIDFLIHNSQFLGKLLPVFSNFLVIMDKCMQVNPKTAYDLFEAFARHKLFSVGYDRSEELAKEMLEHFIGDREIATYILEQLHSYEERRIKNAEYNSSYNERQRLSRERINAIKRK